VRFTFYKHNEAERRKIVPLHRKEAAVSLVDGLASYTRAKTSDVKPVVLNLFHCWDPLNATDVVWDPQIKIEKVCAPE